MSATELHPEDKRHGTSHAYRNLGCRCEECCNADRAARQHYDNTKRERVISRETNTPKPPFLLAAQGACAGTDPALFFPKRSELGGLVEKAKAVCRRCPIQAECLGYAMTAPYDAGVWGGTSEKDRQRMRRRARWVAEHEQDVAS